MRLEAHPIIQVTKRRPIRFYFEGQPILGYEGDTIASALLASGIRVLRYSPFHRRPRGFFCAVGSCSSCLMKVNGIPNVRVCVEPLREGLDVRMQVGRGDFKGSDPK